MATGYYGERKQLSNSGEQARDTSISFSGKRENTLYLRKKTKHGPPYDRPSVHQQDSHIITPAQESLYMVPIVNPSTALGISAAQEIHDEYCGVSISTAAARASRSFMFIPPAGPLFRDLQDNCYKCRRIRLVKGRDLISPLRHLSDHNMVQGFKLQLDIGGPWSVYTKAKNYTGQLKGSKRHKKDVVVVVH